MDSKTWLAQATVKLKNAGISTARLDSLILLEDELGIDRALILAEPKPINSTRLTSLNKNLERRFKHEPLSYIRGKTEFFGRDFFINQDVLEPRPESETMIELLLNLADSDSTTIIDVGTGSGALAVSAKLELPKARVIAIDIDKNCLKVAQKNAKTHNTKIEFYKSDLLEAVPSTIYHLPTILLCNLPYVPTTWHINKAAHHEPRLAIFGGKDGLDLYRRLFSQIDLFNWKPRYILSESLPPQHKMLQIIARKACYKLKTSEDFIQVFSSN